MPRFTKKAPMDPKDLAIQAPDVTEAMYPEHMPTDADGTPKSEGEVDESSVAKLGALNVESARANREANKILNRKNNGEGKVAWNTESPLELLLLVREMWPSSAMRIYIRRTLPTPLDYAPVEASMFEKPEDLHRHLAGPSVHLLNGPPAEDCTYEVKWLEGARKERARGKIRIPGMKKAPAPETSPASPGMMPPWQMGAGMPGYAYPPAGPGSVPGLGYPQALPAPPPAPPPPPPPAPAPPAAQTSAPPYPTSMTTAPLSQHDPNMMLSLGAATGAAGTMAEQVRALQAAQLEERRRFEDALLKERERNDALTRQIMDIHAKLGMQAPVPASAPVAPAPAPAPAATPAVPPGYRLVAEPPPLPQAPPGYRLVADPASLPPPPPGYRFVPDTPVSPAQVGVGTPGAAPVSPPAYVAPAVDPMAALADQLVQQEATFERIENVMTRRRARMEPMSLPASDDDAEAPEPDRPYDQVPIPGVPGASILLDKTTGDMKWGPTVMQNMPLIGEAMGKGAELIKAVVASRQPPAPPPITTTAHPAPLPPAPTPFPVAAPPPAPAPVPVTNGAPVTNGFEAPDAWAEFIKDAAP